MRTKKNKIFRGAALVELRGSKNQREMADLLGVSVATWSSYENDTREPDLSTVMKICKIFNVQVPYLLKGRATECDGKTDPPPEIKVSITETDVAKLIESEHTLVETNHKLTDQIIELTHIIAERNRCTPVDHAHGGGGRATRHAAIG